ncbi:MAG TPA: prephenate dehydrogenase [Ktedonobacterales bacterium]|nr:prephenate dehydrogenase [Ktedonobacterales bacterium]
MQTVGVIGLGLIGGSLGLALKQQRDSLGEQSYRVIGYDSSPERRQQAEQLQAVDQTSDDLITLAQRAQMLIIATPVLAVRQVLAAIAPHLRPGTLVTDTASTKAAVLRWASELLPAGTHFIGGHPMAGGTGSLEDARPDLFHGTTYCVVTPWQTEDTGEDVEDAEEASETAEARLEDVIAALGAKPLRIDAQTHDRCVAAISHLPFLTSTALVETVADSPDHELMRQLASSGFRDTSRLAAGDPTMYQGIALTNREAITFWIDAYITRLQAIRQVLQAESGQDTEGEALLALFRQARLHRKDLLG